MTGRDVRRDSLGPYRTPPRGTMPVPDTLAFLRGRWRLERRLDEGPLGYDRAVWDRMATELGLHGLAIPEEYGGAGFSFTELGVVLEEMGRALLCAPFFASVVLAAELLKAIDDEQARKDYLPGIALGDTKAPTSTVWRPEATSASMNAIRAVTPTGVLSFCRPSRGPISMMRTVSPIALLT